MFGSQTQSLVHHRLRDERGALTLPGLFMALLLVAMLYMVVGIGRTLLLREGMQDAADAAAYSSAIFHARGMNLIALINLIMAALVAILVALRVTQSLFAMAATALFGLAWATAGATLPLSAWCTYQAVQFQSYFQRAKGVVDPILKGLHTTQEATSVIVPWVAMTDGMIEAAAHHPPAKGAFALPGAIALPVESDEFSLLCSKGAGMATHLAMSPLRVIGKGLGPAGKLVDKALDEVEEASEEIAKSTSEFLCGDGSGSPPTHTQEYEESYPEPQEVEICKTDPESSECESIRRDMEDAVPGRRGECASGRCGYYEPYEMYARKARLYCEPRDGNRPETYTWQKREGRANFVWTGLEWEVLERTREHITLEPETSLPPCGHPLATVDPLEYQRHSGLPEQEEPDPLCRIEGEELDAIQNPDVGLIIYEVEYVEATRIFGCTFKRYKTHSLADQGDAFGGSGSEAKSPHKVEDDLSLGDEAFQIRALAFGEKPDPGQTSKNAVLLTARGHEWGKGARGFVAELGQQLGRFSIAQSEYYVGGSAVPRAEWLWSTKWTARLKHFRLPNEDDRENEERRQDASASKNGQKVSQFGGLSSATSASEACALVGGNQCDDAQDSLSSFDEWVRH